MDLNKLIYFITVAEKQNITHAAEELHMTQPPLSRAMRELEDELGVTLFTRGKKKFTLTEEGRYFLEQSNNILKMIDNTKSHLLEIHDEALSGKLRIGTTESAAGSILPGIIGRMKMLYPKVSYEIYCGNSTDICNKLYSGLIDVAFVRSPYDQSDFVSKFVARQKLIAFTGKQHRLADHDSVTVSELAGESLILPSRPGFRDEILTWFTGREQDIHIFAEYNQVISIWPLVADNIGCAICPETDRLLMDERRLKFMHIEGVEQHSELFVIYLRNAEPAPLVKAFVELTE